MSTLTPPTSPLLRDAAEGRAMLLPWTVEQYHWAIETGYVPEDTAYELLDGWIVRNANARRARQAVDKIVSVRRNAASWRPRQHQDPMRADRARATRDAR